MISSETIAVLETRGLGYILGVRGRTDKLVRDVVLNVCMNHQQAERVPVGHL